MNIDEILLTPKEAKEICRKFQTDRDTWLECDKYDTCHDCPLLFKAQCLKLLEWLKKILYEICPHKEYPQRNKIDCTLCVMECISELESKLKEA
jgi:hypothetical protein